MTQSNPPGWPPTYPRADGPGPLLADQHAVVAGVLVGVLLWVARIGGNW